MFRLLAVSVLSTVAFSAPANAEVAFSVGDHVIFCVEDCAHMSRAEYLATQPAAETAWLKGRGEAIDVLRAARGFHYGIPELIAEMHELGYFPLPRPKPSR